MYLSSSQISYLTAEKQLKLTSDGVSTGISRSEALYQVSQDAMNISPKKMHLILYLSQSIDCALPPWGEMQQIIEDMEFYVAQDLWAKSTFLNLVDEHDEWIDFIRLIVAIKFHFSTDSLNC